MSERAVASTETDRLAKLIRLIFSSDNSGEIVAAVTAAKRVLASENVDAHWLADALERGAAPVVVTPEDESGERDDRDRDDDRPDADDRSKAWFAWHRRFLLSAKERQFVERVVSWRGPLSVKQRQWLRAIVDRLEAS
jgi:hypothetical protein